MNLVQAVALGGEAEVLRGVAGGVGVMERACGDLVAVGAVGEAAVWECIVKGRVAKNPRDRQPATSLWTDAGES